MKNKLNKKGFTLVELLAVIVILALIMGIAVFSIGGVMDNAKANTARRSAGQIIEGTRLLLSEAGKLDVGTYFVQSSLLEKGTESPFGGSWNFAAAGASTVTFGASSVAVTSVATGIYKSGTAKTTGISSDCATGAGAVPSYVVITKNASGAYEYSICLTAGAGNKYINGTEADISKDVAGVIKP